MLSDLELRVGVAPLQDGLEQAWRFAMYRGVEAPEITINASYASPSGRRDG